MRVRSASSSSPGAGGGGDAGRCLARRGGPSGGRGVWGRRGRGALLRGVAVGGGGGCPGGMSGGRCGRAGRGLLRSFVSGCLLEERAGARGGWGVPSEDAFLRDVPGGEGRGGENGVPRRDVGGDM